MKTVNSYYSTLNSSLIQSPRYTVELAYDFASTDLVYFTSHTDSQVPSGATVLASVIADNGLSGTSQKLNPLEANATIGAITLKLLDYGGLISAQINAKLTAGSGLKGKRVRIYRGFEGLAWADYELFQTQIVDTVDWDAGVYTIKCADVQRSQRQKIFELKSTNLTASIGTTDTLIPVASYAELIRVKHGPSYSDAPNSTVGYVLVDDEVIRYSGYTVDSLKGPCLVVDTANVRGRGALGTVPAEHTVDASTSTDRRTEVEEFVYLELPLVKLAYAILTGTLYGDTASLPDHWHLNISTNYVSTSEFVLIGPDWWDTTDDTEGRIGRFAGLDGTDGKKFLEQEIYRLLGAYSPVLADGSLGLRRLTRVLYDASAVVSIGPSEIISHTALTHDMGEVANQLRIDWNYDFIEDDYTRTNLLIDADSITTHGASAVKTLEFRGLHGSRHTLNTLYEHFSTLRDRYSGPPQRIKVTLLGRHHRIEVGDIVRLTHPQINDYVRGGTIDRAFEVQQVSIDWASGRVTLDLFGSSQAAGLQALADTDVMLDSYYTSAGVNLETLPGVTNISGVIHITANLDLTSTVGATDATNSAAIVYANGPLSVDPNVTVTCKLNTQWRVKGHLQIDGAITTKGRGFTGATSSPPPSAKNVWDPAWYVFTYPADPGVPRLGTALSQGGVVIGDSHDVRRGAITYAINALPYYALTNKTGTAIGGLPRYLVGTAGPTGGHSAINGGSSADTFIQGGSGGNSGGGLLIICRGLDIGAGGQINVSGNNGTQGAVVGDAAAGAGAGGFCGGVVVLLDGNVTYPTGLSRILCYRGVSPYRGTPVYPNQLVDHPGHLVSSAYEEGALSYFDASASMLRVQYIPANQTAVADTPTVTSVPTAISIVENSNTPQTPAENLATLDISVTAPADSTYAYSDIYYKLPTQDAWIYIGPADTETVVTLPMDGTTYDVKAVPISIFGTESTEYITTQVTLSSQAGGVSLGTGNYISYGKTSFADTTNGFWIGVNTLNVVQINVGDITDSLQWDGTNLDITGTIIAEAGAIGGWTINAQNIESPDGRIRLDAFGDQIVAENAGGTNYVTLDGDGLRAYDAVLGQTVNIPTNGNPPEFSSGIIHEYTYEIYTSGVIRTDADPATNGGVLINNSGLAVYDSSGTRTAYLDGINSAHEFTGSITIKGGDYPYSTGNLIFDPFFNEKIVRGIDYWIDHTRATYAASSGENGSAGVTLYPNGTNVEVFETQYIPAKVYQKFYVSTRVYETVGLNGNYGIQIYTYDANKNDLASNVGQLIAAGTNQGVWKNFFFEFSVTAGSAAYIRMALTVDNTATTGSLVYDTVSLVPSDISNNAADFPPNLLKNPTGKLGSTTYWTATSNGGFNVTLGTSGEGHYFYRDSVASTTTIVHTSDYIPISAGKIITLSADMYSSGLASGLFYIDVIYYDSSFGILYPEGPQITRSTTYAWARENASGTTIANTAYCRIRIVLDSGTVVGSAVAIKRIKLEVGSVPTPYNDGDYGSDVTHTAVSNGLTITSGYMTYGTNTLRVDFANRRLTIGSEAYGSAGVQLEYNSGSPRAYVGNGSNNYFNYDGANVTISGTLYASQIYTATSGTRIEFNPSQDGQIHMYANDGVSIAEVAKVGLNSDGTYNYTASFGSLASGRTIGGLQAMSATGIAIRAWTNASTGKAVYASTGAGGIAYYASVGPSTGNVSIGMKIDVPYTVGYYNVHMQLTPQIGITGTPPSTLGNNGALTVDSAGDLWFKKGGSWQKLSA